MGKKIVLLVLIAVFAAIAVLAVLRYQESKAKENAQKRPDDAIVVNVVEPEHVDMLDERVYSGTTQAWSSFDIDPEISAKLVSLKFNRGDQIKRGDLIAQLDDSNYDQAVKQAEADLEVAKAKLEEVEAQLEYNRAEYNERTNPLYQSGSVSESELKKAQIEIKKMEASLSQCKANIQNCEARLAAAQVKLNDTKIFADWDSGSDIRHVGYRYVDEGSLVSPGKPILKIIEIDPIKARIQIIERDFRFLQMGLKAEVTSDAYPGEVFEGTVIEVPSELNENTRSADAILSIPNKDFRLKPGMFLRVRIVFSEHKNAQTIPPNAILTRNDRRGVFTIKRPQNAENEADFSATATFVPVMTGLEDRKRVEILSPAFENDCLIVTVGNHKLEDGKQAVISGLNREQVAKSIADQKKAEQEKAGQKPAAGQDQPERKPAAGQSGTGASAASGDSAK